jgi:raffinose/stachyose/melibiose transport system permease protein
MRLVEGRSTLIITYLVLGLAAFTALFPIALLLLNSVKGAAEIVQNPLALPKELRWDNFGRAWIDAKFSRTIVNSILLTGLTIVLVCTTGSAAAYVLARKKVKSWRVVTGYLLATTTAPIQLFLFPLYFGFAKLGLINNVFAVSLVYTAIYSPFAIMLLRTYFLAVPKELEEAALVDGATHWQIFTRVMLPIVSPGILTVALIVGLYSWNEFLIATTFLQQQDRLTAVVSFFLLSGQYTSDWGEIMAAALIIVLPVVILFVFLQRRFIEGMAGGSVKG